MIKTELLSFIKKMMENKTIWKGLKIEYCLSSCVVIID